MEYLKGMNKTDEFYRAACFQTCIFFNVASNVILLSGSVHVFQQEIEEGNRCFSLQHDALFKFHAISALQK